MKWNYLVDLYNDGIITNTPTANSNNNSIKGATTTGTTGDASGVYPVGTHKITWTVEDQCGNQAIKEYTFIVKDAKKPTPYCLSALAAVVMPVQGFVELWAKDYDKGSSDNCPGKLVFTFDGARPTSAQLSPNFVANATNIYFKGQGQSATKAEYEAGLAQKWDKIACSSSMYFDCDDVDNSPLELQMSVWDAALNTDFCTVTINVQANGTSCTGSRIAGNISRSQTEMVKDVAVTVRNQSNNETKLAMTNAAGQFEFYGLPTSNNYVLTPEKDVDHLNGVTTLDLVLMQRHILGINKFDNAYKYLAGDANKDNKVTANDLVELRKLILGVYSKLPANKSWRFVDKSAQIPDIANPWNVAESIAIQNFNNTMTNNHFVAIKVGDINNSATVNANSPLEERGKSTLTFATEDMTFVKGEDVVINITSDNFAQIVGAQWNVNFDAANMEYKSILPGALKLTHENTNDLLAQRGKLSFSWNDVKGQTFAKDEILFTLVFRATANNQLSKSMSIVSEPSFTSEAYAQDLSKLQIAMNFTSRTAEQFELGQNNPNPFTDKTTVGFTLPKAATATLTIYDLTGKVVRMYSSEYVKGYNEIIISAEDLKATGVLFYELESEGHKSTKKMIYLGR
jgi:large repetitive protein